MKKLLLFAVILFAFQICNAQEIDPTTEENQSEYYYCFAMFLDTIYYTPILEFPMDTISKMPYVEENWTSHVHQEMKREHFVPVVIGPYGQQLDAQADQDNWATIFHDTVAVIKIEYILE